MEQNNNSDTNTAMLASQAFYNILDQIQSSNLNFMLQVSPFSAQISLRKSLVKDKEGIPLLPQPLKQSVPPTTVELKALEVKNLKLENDLFILRKKHTEIVGEFTNVKENIKTLEAVQESINQDMNVKISMLEEENSILKKKGEEAATEACVLS